MTVKEKLKKKLKPKSKTQISSKMINEIQNMIRVNHAGEYGAKRIYEGQIAVFKKEHKDPSLIALVETMLSHEMEHLHFFEKELRNRKIGPTILHPLWHFAGWTLGAVTAKIGKEAAMACTVAIEEVIDKHYQSQIKKLKSHPTIVKKEKALIQNIEKFRQDELHHRDIGLENHACNAPLYSLIKKTIQKTSHIAIWLSTKF